MTTEGGQNIVLELDNLDLGGLGESSTLSLPAAEDADVGYGPDDKKDEAKLKKSEDESPSSKKSKKAEDDEDNSSVDSVWENAGRFSNLSEDILEMIVGNLDIPSFRNFTASCRAFHQLSTDDNWKLVMHLKNDADLRGEKVKYTLKLEDDLRARIAFKAQQKERRDKRFQKRMYHICMWIGGSRPYEFVFSCCPLLLLIFSSLKLDHHIDASWGSVMAPGFFMVANVIWQPLIYATAMIIAGFRGGRGNFWRRYGDSGWIRPMLFRYTFYIGISSYKTWLPVITTAVFTVIAVSIGLPMIWFAGHCDYLGCDSDGFGYFVPLMLVFFVLMVMTIVGIITSQFRFDGILGFPIAFFLFLSTLFIMLNVDGYVHWNWSKAFAPLFCLVGWMIISCILAFFGLAWGGRSYTKHTALGSEEDIFRIAILVMFFLVVLPLTAVTILLCLIFDGIIDISYTAALAPLYIMCVVFIIAYIVLYCINKGRC